MSKLKTTLSRSEEVADGTRAFYFEKPAGFTYKAGQSIDLFLIDPPETDAEGNKRAFSLASAPHEAHLMVATRMRDTAFKRVLGKMHKGATLELEGPFGDFTLPNSSAKPIVFLTGGIGVTAVHSIVLDAVQRKLPHTIYVFYSNRRPEDAAFLTELTEAVKGTPITLIPTMTGMENSKVAWTGKTGYIDAEMIEHIVSEPKSALYYLDGPATMVTAMRTALHELRVDDDNITTEEFSGY